MIYTGKVAYDYKGDCPSKVVLKNDTTGIEDDAFLWCGELTEIEMPDGVSFIGSEAFYNCGSLKSVTIPRSVD